ncbi:acetyl-CoA synthetase [Sulfurifustis variabilis]|uniref:Acetyl-CoA synthetase n=1 Tax=Sulfurifustis variabilis TaxID=1675686 RepID=A0A1B4VDB4_9GAMM|nr:bifunctional acetate--CoA ligase family protein/GNAT family N-acetyltransferase [Sulfurifustis variabilis]BAU47657.1 acetyl-CoA synthetase [Sulfurifustis variabilis]
MGQHYLDHLFGPHALAVFGASPKAETVGGRVLANVRAAGFAGPIHPINPKYREIEGLRCYETIDEIGQPVDLAVIATPARTVPEILHACGEHGVRAAIVMSAGFAEVEGGAERERAMLEVARRYNLRILGPNCLGLIRPQARLNATFSNNQALPGPLALVSQSGALCTAILDWAEARGIGFSAMVSLGAAADVDFGDVLDYLALDPQTRSILLYIEGIRNARSFLSGLRVAARLKPVVVIKAGRHAEGSRAVQSHTGALVGGDDVFDAALARAGAVRVYTISQLFAAAQLLATRCRVRGDRVAMVTNAGGPGVMATDRAVDLGIGIAEIAPSTIAGLNDALPPTWSHGNPIDILGDADPARYGAATRAALSDPNVDGVLVMLTPQAMTHPTECADAVIGAAADSEKPLLACWLGERQVREGRARLLAAGVPTFLRPESAVEAFAHLAHYQKNQALLRQVPGPLARGSEPDTAGARLIIEGALAERRTLLTGLETGAVLRAFGIPVMPAIEARSANEALVAAESLGFPVALKISSPAITHKSEVAGVRLNIQDAAAVRGAYNDLVRSVREKRPDADIRGATVERMYRGTHGRELLVGVLRDPVFGPVIAFGAGGTAVEVLRDRAVALPPLNDFIARRLIERTRIAGMLGPFRSLPAIDFDALLALLRRVSEMVCELPQIRELDINPLMADEHGVVALDARIVVSAPAPAARPYAHMAIHPYPVHFTTRLQLPDGTDIVIRPIRPEDAEIEQTFVRKLSSRSKYFRFMQTLRELTPEMLVRFTQIDYDRELALIAVTRQDGHDVEIGVTRYVLNPDGESGEFALVVADEWQAKGIGSRLLGALIDAARSRGLRSIDGEVLEENAPMLHLVRKLGFEVHPSPDDPHVKTVVRRL